MTGRSNSRLRKMLAARGIFPEEEISRIENAAISGRCSIQSYIISEGLLDEGRLLSMVAESEGLEFINLHEVAPEESAIKAVPAKFTWHYDFVPIKLDGNMLLSR
jgi:hypothetical protein